MAHFATLDESNIVTRVEAIVNDVILDGDGVEQEQLGIDFLTSLYGEGNYKQTSYNNNFRKQYAGKGFTYDAAKDKFIEPQPYPSWSLDGNDDWQAPVTFPTDATDKRIRWDEAGQKWTATDGSDPVNNFNWDASALAWVSA